MHPQEEIWGDLVLIESGLRRLKNGSASAVKFVYKIDNTP